MYSIDLARISLVEFEAMIAAAELTPGRRKLKDGLALNIERLRQHGIQDLQALQKLLRNKQRYPEISAELGISAEYLTVLNREINSYVSRPIPLERLGCFSELELARLGMEGLRSTRDLYERGLDAAVRGDLAKRLQIPLGDIESGLELSDLLRINGVGPVFAGLLQRSGIRNAAAFRTTEAQEILQAYQDANSAQGGGWPRLGLSDIEYCQRFCRKLDLDIEW